PLVVLARTTGGPSFHKTGAREHPPPDRARDPVRARILAAGRQPRAMLARTEVGRRARAPMRARTPRARRLAHHVLARMPSSPNAGTRARTATRARFRRGADRVTSVEPASS